jgi:hypothetical protein
MASDETNGNEQDREVDRETERYRQAAVRALDQLEWCIDYFYGLRKTELARALARNRKQIIERAGLWSVADARVGWRLRPAAPAQTAAVGGHVAVRQSGHSDGVALLPRPHRPGS